MLARGLEKHFGGFAAVDGVDFEVHQGEAFGFLGPNGAGKSSTMRMIGATSTRTRGELSGTGPRPRPQRPRDQGPPRASSPRRTTSTWSCRWPTTCSFTGVTSASRVRCCAGVSSSCSTSPAFPSGRGDRVDNLSGGHEKPPHHRPVLVNEPELLLLDEPTTGLDPQARHVLWDRLYTLKHQGVTLVLTTHYMEEAEQLCDRLVVMDKGRIMAQGSPRELVEAHMSREVVELRVPPGQAPAMAPRTWRAWPNGSRPWPGASCSIPTTVMPPPSSCTPRACGPLSVLVRRASLEDVFLRLTGRQLTD